MTEGGAGQVAAAARDGSVRSALSAWYEAECRDLPWRRTRDAYAIWVSEVVCQQTRIVTAIPYYEAFLAEFPTVRALAEAPLDRVLARWSGLGYYARARNFHAAARAVLAFHGGRVPMEAEAFLALPGVGDYTAAAVLSIAGGIALAAVDGNVRRVLSRLDDLDEPSQGRLRDRATQLLDQSDPGQWNQAVMELGALVCTPSAPRCDLCPLAQHCRALERGTVAERPAPRRKTPVRDIHMAAIWDSTPEGVILDRRPGGGGIWSDLWMVPLVEIAVGNDPVAACEAKGLSNTVLAAATPVVAVLTHRRIHLYLVKGTWSASDARRVLPEDWKELGVPAALHRVREAVERISSSPTL